MTSPDTRRLSTFLSLAPEQGATAVTAPNSPADKPAARAQSISSDSDNSSVAADDDKPVLRFLKLGHSADKAVSDWA